MAGTTYKDLSEDLSLVLQPLEFLRIPVKTWTTTELARRFITTESFISNVKKAILIDKDVVPYNEMSLAVQRGFWTQNSKCTPTTMMKFCNFLKSKEGSEVLADFKKKAELNFFGYAHMLSYQLRAFDNAREWPTARIEAKIADHRRQIVLLEKELEKEIGEVERCYLPASQYVPLTEQELLKRCYKMYVDKGEEKLKELDQEQLEFVKSKYEEEVRLLHMGNFMVDEKRKRLLKFWTDERDETHGLSS